MTVRIVTDSSCDLSQDVADRLGIEIVPLSIRFGDDELVDRRDFTVDEFYRRCSESPVLPETAAPSPGAFEEAFRRQADAGADGVVCINLSGGLSATIESAELAARNVAEAGLDVRVVDSRSVTLGLGLICEAAAQAGAEGQGLDDVARLAEDLAARTRVFATLDTLDNLKKGGRIGGAQAFLGSLLSIKPIIEVRGEVHEAAKQRTRARAIRWLVDRVTEDGPVTRLAAMHAGCPDDLDALVAALRERHDGEIVTGDIGAVIAAHGGIGTLGVIYQTAA